MGAIYVHRGPFGRRQLAFRSHRLKRLKSVKLVVCNTHERIEGLFRRNSREAQWGGAPSASPNPL